jgi:EmrB/QacA subfamily drug resistance transporter
MSPAPDPHHERRWLILGVIAIAQLLVVLDVTIVNIALPSAQQDLGFSDENRQWVITAYALAFGSLLLLGGRIADLFGRKWTFIGGLLGFAGASAIGGAASSFEMLVGARALQGMFGAMLAPAALSLLTVTFTDPHERGKAFGVFAAIAGAGGAVGLLLGGALTEVLDWRWCLYVSILFAVPAATAALRLLHHVPVPQRPRLDLPGTLTASLGLFAVVFGFSRAEADGWGATSTVAALAAGVVLLAVFVVLQRRVRSPLLPLRVVLDRNRGGAYLSIAFAAAGIFGVFLFLTFYLQQTKGLNPLETGVAFVPMNIVTILTAAIGSQKLIPRTGPKPLVAIGMTLAAVSMALLSRVGVDTPYASHVLLSLLLVGLGFGLVIACAIATATYGVPARDTGVASAMVNTSQQVGGSIGIALLTTMAAGAATDFVAANGAAPEALRQAAVEGYQTGCWWAAGIFAFGAVVCGGLLRADVRPAAHAAAEAAPA